LQLREPGEWLARLQGKLTGSVRVIIFGATGMVGQGALREALADTRVELVLTVGRRATGLTHAKLRELV